MNAISKFMAIVAVLCLAGVSKAQNWEPYFEFDEYYSYYYEGPLSQLGWYEWARANREYFEARRQYYQLLEEQYATEFRALRRSEQEIREQVREERVQKARLRQLAKAAARDAQRAEEAFELVDGMHAGAVLWPVGLTEGWAAERMDEVAALLAAGEPIDGVAQMRLAAIARELRLALTEKGIGGDYDERAEAMHVVVLVEYLVENADSRLLASR